jgi:hypothetical protein
MKKSIEEYRKGRSECKECSRLAEKKRYQKQIEKMKNLNTMKCKHCKKIKPIYDFSKGQRNCIECNKKYRKSKLNKTKIKNDELIIQCKTKTPVNNFYKGKFSKCSDLNSSERICPKCKKIKSKKSFFKNTSHCKSCKNKEKEERRIRRSKLKNFKCTNCNRLKDIKKFYKDCSICISCMKKNIKVRKQNRIKMIENICKICKSTKPGNQFLYSANICNKCYTQIRKKKYRNFQENHPEYYLFRNARRRANKKNLDFNLTIDYVKSLFPENNICPLLEIPMQVGKETVFYNSFTLDRIDPNKGYIMGNVWIVSCKANVSKNNATFYEYKNIVENLKKFSINIDKTPNKKLEVSLGSVLYSAKMRAEKYNLPFNIDKEYLKIIYPANGMCPVLNVKLKKGINKLTSTSPTLDRFIPKLGYVKNNVWFISYRANVIKNNLTIKEMELLLKNWGEILQSK